MSDFDRSTERLKMEHHAERPWAFDVDHRYSLERGRNSAKESLEVLARAVKAAPCHCDSLLDNDCYKCAAIAAVKAAGNWSLEDR